MKIEIHDNMMVKDLKRQFHDAFPALKLEFFSGTVHNRESQLDNEAMLKDFGLKQNGTLIFDAQMKVSEFELMINEHYGLQIQVFRKSGNVFVETTGTDDWTLAQEQTEAESSQNPSDVGIEKDMTDRDKWE